MRHFIYNRLARLKLLPLAWRKWALRRALRHVGPLF